jgi:hypothetical protein
MLVNFSIVKQQQAKVRLAIENGNDSLWQVFIASYKMRTTSSVSISIPTVKSRTKYTLLDSREAPSLFVL